MALDAALHALASRLGPRARLGEPLARYTAMRVGGPAALLAVCESTVEVGRTVEMANTLEVPWLVLGGGCNVLVADAGLPGVFVIVNRASAIQFAPDEQVEQGYRWECALPASAVRAEAGAQIALLARGAVERGLAGLEWAAGLPGTVGGAVVGNAGAFDGNVAACLHSALVLGPDACIIEQQASWFGFEYRTSHIKRQTAGERKSVVLAAEFALQPGNKAALATRAAEILEWRQTRHPSGATMGSTFKNPPGSHAGYLIEQCGLRGHTIGGAQVSQLHGNFFMNTGSATAQDVLSLIDFTRGEVKRQVGYELELEIELLGW